MAAKPAPNAADKHRSERHNRLNMAIVAYDRLENLIVTCALRPGLSLSIQDLQTMTGGGRAPVHSGGQPSGAVAATGRLIAFGETMFDVIEHGIDPALLDCNLTQQAAD
jgi:hypothetical protein